MVEAAEAQAEQKKEAEDTERLKRTTPDGQARAIKQIRSDINTNPSQRGTLAALGLGKIGRKVERDESPAPGPAQGGFTWSRWRRPDG